MAVKNDMSDDVLRYLRERHTGAGKAVISGDIELNFGIGGAVVRQIVNKLRCNGQPVCSDASGYFYTARKLLEWVKKREIKKGRKKPLLRKRINFGSD
jgi:hypothetical protein